MTEINNLELFLCSAAAFLSCSHLKKAHPTATSGNYTIDSDGEGDLEPFSVYCDMTNKNGVGVTVISHDSESKTFLNGFEGQGNTRVILITQEQVYFSWPVSPVPPHTVNSLSSTSVIDQSYSKMERDGGCHVILLRWPIGVEHHLEVASVHAGWPTHVQQTGAVTVMRMTMYGVKTGVSSMTRQGFQ